MIKICYPPGCYGNYLTSSIYNYTNLRADKYKNFSFDHSGSSHHHRKNIKSGCKIQYGHLDSSGMVFNKDDTIVTILPCIDHRLDYYNNQFDKHAKKQLVDYILTQYSSNEIIDKLQRGWNYKKKLNKDTPIWILREFFSFWINDCFSNGYSVDKYINIDSKVLITTQDIFLNFVVTLNQICQVLDLKINIEESEIQATHKQFINAQKYHNSQLKCQQWVDDIIDNNDSSSPCQTIFDESYVQFLLRESGFELQCDGLNTLPTSSMDMKKIIYKI